MDPPHGEITDDPHFVLGSDDLVPAIHKTTVHRLRIVPGPEGAELKDSGMA